MTSPNRGDRLAGLVRLVSIVSVVVGLMLLVRALPLEQGVARLEGVVGQMGVVGMVLFGVAYVVFAVLFIPGSAMTLAAGAVFGLVEGMIVVSLASTTAAAIAFLIARYLARSKVEELAGRYPTFRAIDRAIAEGGWKIIGMLRLSPAMPFSAGNYMFGLTAVGFWPYTLASWVFMMPGTFLYVYLGYAGRAGLNAATQGGGRSPGEWALLVVGLVATVVVTVYVTRLARRSLAQQAELEPAAEPTGTAATEEPTESPGFSPARLALPVIALLVLSSGLWARSQHDRLQYLFGPPAVAAQEAYASDGAGEAFDHSGFDAVLRAHVAPGGAVDYAAIAADPAALDAYIQSLATAPFEEMNRDQKLALLINAYNAFTLRLILDHWPLDSIMSIPSKQRWDARRFELAGRTLSLNQLEHDEIRPRFAEPRIHFALVCAAYGCPPLRAEAYLAARLEAQLEDQTRYVHDSPRWFRYDPVKAEVWATKLYDWYGSDFQQAKGSVLDHMARYSKELRAELEAGHRRKIKIRWISYDWSLNGTRARES